MPKRFMFFIAMIGLCAIPAAADRLLAVNEDPLGPDNALVIEDIAVEKVAYHAASSAAPELWLTFDVSAGDTLVLTLAVPDIPRLSGLRPSVALLAPSGDPNINVPFDLPEGYGGAVLPSDAVTDPQSVREPLTGTNDLQLLAFTLDIPATGKYYLVGFLPLGGAGKFSISVGDKAAFTFNDLFTLSDTISKVRDFHEVGPFGGIFAWFVNFIFILASGISLLFVL